MVIPNIRVKDLKWTHIMTLWLTDFVNKCNIVRINVLNYIVFVAIVSLLLTQAQNYCFSRLCKLTKSVKMTITRLPSNHSRFALYLNELRTNEC